MNTLNKTNLKSLLLYMGDNQVMTASFLLKQGYSYENLKGYIRSGYIDSLGRGAYCKAGTHPSIEAAISAMSEQLGVPVHLGGRTALAKRGYVHFVPFADIFGIPGLEKLQAIQWKRKNLATLRARDQEKFASNVEALKRVIFP